MSTVKGKYVRRRPYPERKRRMLEEATKLLSSYRTVLVINLQGVPAAALHQIRAELRKRGSVMKLIKNTLMRLALKKVYGENNPIVQEMENYLTGQNIFVFSNENPFELCMFLEKNKVFREARPGDIAPSEIVIPAGNTGIPPGPILSRFSRLRIPARIQEGTIWVVKDTVVAKPGDVISPELAEILMRLGIKPIPIELKVKAALSDKMVIPGEQLILNIDQYRSDIENAVRFAMNLAVNAAIPVPEAMKYVISLAHTRAVNLAVNAGILTSETAPLLLAKAHAEAQILAAVLSSKVPELGIRVELPQIPKPVEKVEEKKEEKPKEEEKEETTEESIAEGLASLFG
ncbi:MAG: 50S ribosomal protein L10 [Thermoprotei archaeon]|nr:MAG: 50S ribosomal protein L10 [Thermoprotei archaeon]